MSVHSVSLGASGSLAIHFGHRPHSQHRPMAQARRIWSRSATERRVAFRSTFTRSRQVLRFTAYPCLASQTEIRSCSQTRTCRAFSASCPGSRIPTTFSDAGPAARAAKARRNARAALFPSICRCASTKSLSAAFVKASGFGSVFCGFVTTFSGCSANERNLNVVRYRRRLGTEATHNGVTAQGSVAYPTLEARDHRKQGDFWAGSASAQPKAQNRHCSQGRLP